MRPFSVMVMFSVKLLARDETFFSPGNVFYEIVTFFSPGNVFYETVG